MAFGEKLQEVRKQSGMTQETFAEQLHVSRQAVSRWESGRGYPEIEKILYICHRYHTTLDALFADELPPIEAEEAEVEQPIAGKPLKRSFVDFLSNLSPYDKLIGGTLSVNDLPAAWNKLYKEYLGVDVPDDTHGVLQDSHWSGGSFGYFPSYAIGSAYGAQFMDAMRKDVDVDAVIRSGDLSPVVDWLTDKIYRFGMVKTPEQLIRDTCGAPFDPQFYVDYLTAKFTDIYGL